MNKEIVLVTNNKHKLEEFRKILSPLGYIVYSPADLNISADPVENGTTYFENSYIKASAFKQLVPFPVIADDSGLELLSLNRFPGLHSARFASEFDNNYVKAGNELNKRLGSMNREAEFHCVICYLSNLEAKPLYFEGICKGIFEDTPKGCGGFGYDPFFYSTELNKNLGEASSEEKNQISHRAKAIKKLVTFLSIK